jgi:hypothetical protein
VDIRAQEKERFKVSETSRIKFPELLQLRLPRGTNAALDELANRLHRSKSELVRQAILREVSPEVSRG